MADLKTTQLPENTTPTAATLLPSVTDPGGTPVTQRLTLGVLAAWLATLAQSLANKTLVSPIISGIMTYVQADAQVSALGNLGATESIDWATATHFTGNLDSNVTITFANVAAGRRIHLYLSHSGAQRTIIWPTIVWLGNATGSAPATPAVTGNVLAVDLVSIGGVIYGRASGNYAV